MARTSILPGPAFQAPTFFLVSLAVVVPFYPVALSVTIVTAEHAMVKHSGNCHPLLSPPEDILRQTTQTTAGSISNLTILAQLNI